MRLCTVDVVLHSSVSCSRACSKRGWMINVYKSQFSLQWKSHPVCAGNLHSCCSWSRVSPVCALALNISGQKKKPPSSALWPSHASPPPPLPPAGLDCGWRGGEGSYSSHSHLVCLLSSPCCVAHNEPCFPFAVFCCELSGTFLLF